MEKLLIKTKSKEYFVYVGEVLFELENVINSFNKKPTSIMIITDDNVSKLYLQTIEEILQSFQLITHIIPNGEKHKSFESYYECHTIALENGLDRNSLIIALGGGVVGDLAGFVAATYMRGIRYIQIPTTLLAHDSAVGGKVAINHPMGKNMIGAFYQPEAVIYHIPFLQTLPLGEKRSGFAEVMKHGLLDKNKFIEWIDKNIPTLENISIENLTHIVTEGIRVKSEIVSLDETESGIRAYLNFGHTLGHAIESEMGYGTITHGDAIAIGMKFAMLVSEEIFNINLDIDKFDSFLFRYQYPDIPILEIDALIGKMKQDKKSYEGIIHMVLMKDIGEMEVVKIPEEIVRNKLVNFLVR